MVYFDAPKAIFDQIDANHDGRIDRNEFPSWLANADELTFPFSSNGQSQRSPYGKNPSGFSVNRDTPLIAAVTGTSPNSLSSTGTVETNSEQHTNEYLLQSAGSIYNDPNPEILRRAASIGPVTYQQNIYLRFLQPPALPAPGPLIIKEVRPPQPPPPPPLVVRQHAQPLPPLPPLILRERPPTPPAPVASQTVIRRLAAGPVPPRSVIIEHHPPLPPKPRDIIIERWIPYGPQAKRRVVVQRAAPAVEYPKPRNVIVVHDNVQTRVVRQFQRLGVAQENPQTYAARYGASLLDAVTVVQQARNAGVVEDLSPPTMSRSTELDFSTSPYGNTPGFEGLRVMDDVETGTFDLDVSQINANGIYQNGRLDRVMFERSMQGDA